MMSFQDLGSIFFVHNKPEAEAKRIYAHDLSLSCNSTLHEKTTYSVLSVLILIYD